MKKQTIENNNVLVLIQLTGGNDSLGTVIPYKDDNYYRARGSLAIRAHFVPITDAVTLHPSMTGMAEMFENNHLAIIQGVGYQNTSQSHFRGMDIWHSGSDANESKSTGWLDHYLKTLSTTPASIQIGRSSSLLTQATGFNFENPEYFYKLLSNTPEDRPGESNMEKELVYINTQKWKTNKYAEKIKEAAGKVHQQGSYPNNSLGQQLKIVARLIAGGLPTKLYVVTADGSFDTHANQLGQHAWLLQQLSDSVAAFQKDCVGLGIAERVIGMTFSEFSRRIVANGSGGTDHGGPGAMFCFGAKVKGGVFGPNPAIPANAVVSDNIPLTYDYRQIYAPAIEFIGGKLDRVVEGVKYIV